MTEYLEIKLRKVVDKYIEVVVEYEGTVSNIGILSPAQRNELADHLREVAEELEFTVCTSSAEQ